jgi:hypothetical protein
VVVRPPRRNHAHPRSRLVQPGLYELAVRVCLAVARGQAHHGGVYLIEDLLDAGWTPATLWSMALSAAGVAA